MKADLIAAVRTASCKPYLPERECLAIVRAVLGVVREPSGRMINAAHAEPTAYALRYLKAMIDALLREVAE